MEQAGPHNTRWAIGYEKAGLPDLAATLSQAGIAILIDARDPPAEGAKRAGAAPGSGSGASLLSVTSVSER
jgi:hypothetical protein